MSQITIRTLDNKQAQILSDYLPVRLRDFWMSMHPLAQAYLYEQSSCKEEFFILIDMEFARFSKYGLGYNPSAKMWCYKVTTIEHTISFKGIAPDILLTET